MNRYTIDFECGIKFKLYYDERVNLFFMLSLALVLFVVHFMSYTSTDDFSHNGLFNRAEKRLNFYFHDYAVTYQNYITKVKVIVVHS